MGLLEDEQQRRDQQQSRRQQIIATIFKAIFLLTLPIIFCLLLLLLALDLGGVGFLKWVDQHPGFAARYNPHHSADESSCLVSHPPFGS